MTRRIVTLALLLGVIVAASSIPNLRFLPVEVADVVVRKIGHVVVYGAAAFVATDLAAAVPSGGWRRVAPWLVLTVIAGIALGDELNQVRVVGREPSLVDVTLDVVGGLGGVVAWLRTWGRRPAAG